MSEWKPIEYPRGNLEVLADLVVRFAEVQPDVDVAALWGDLVNATWPSPEAPVTVTIEPDINTLDPLKWGNMRNNELFSPTPKPVSLDYE